MGAKTMERFYDSLATFIFASLRYTLRYNGRLKYLLVNFSGDFALYLNINYPIYIKDQTFFIVNMFWTIRMLVWTKI